MLHATRYKERAKYLEKSKISSNHHDHAPDIPPTGQEIPVCEVRYRVHNKPPVKSILKQPNPFYSWCTLHSVRKVHKWESQGFFL